MLKSMGSSGNKMYFLGYGSYDLFAQQESRTFLQLKGRRGCDLALCKQPNLNPLKG